MAWRVAASRPSPVAGSLGLSICVGSPGSAIVAMASARPGHDKAAP